METCSNHVNVISASTKPQNIKSQYVMPLTATLHLTSRNVTDQIQLWKHQSVLLMVHIFRLYNVVSFKIDEKQDVIHDGTTYPKPALMFTRNISSDETGPTATFVESDMTEILFEHLYKMNLYLNRQPKKSLLEEVITNSSGDIPVSTPIADIPNPKRAKMLRGGRKQYITLALISGNFFSNLITQVSSVISELNNGINTTQNWLPSEVLIMTKKLALSPFFGGPTLSVLDYVASIVIRDYLACLINASKFEEMAPSLINILEWIERIQAYDDWKEATHLERGFTQHEMFKPYAIGDPLLLECYIPGRLSPAVFKQKISAMHSPKFDWITDRKRNHHLVRTPYEELLQKLAKASITVPDHTFLHPNGDPLAPIEESFLPWGSIPFQLDPAHGSLNKGRASRKRQQISNILHYVARIVEDGSHVVDFCGGGGHISLVLAWLFPNIKVTLLDRNEVSLAMASKRKFELKLENMNIECSDVNEWKPSSPFQVGVAIHACASLSDIIMEQCIKANASYVMAPCCFGSLQNCDTSVIKLPRSSLFEDAGVTIEDYMTLASCADVNTGTVSLDSAQYKSGKQAMAIIDHDRNSRASQDGYSTFQFTMRPPTCTPKNEIICGISPLTKQTYAHLSKQLVNGSVVLNPEIFEASPVVSIRSH